MGQCNKMLEEMSLGCIGIYLKKEEPASPFKRMEYVDGVTIDRFEPLDGGKSWDDIFEQLNRSRSATYRVHASALEHFKIPIKVETKRD